MRESRGVDWNGERRGGAPKRMETREAQFEKMAVHFSIFCSIKTKSSF
jgi:hypothetical protein